MNLLAIAKKLQTAILQKGLVIKINKCQFFSAEQKRLINKYIITTPVYSRKRAGQWGDTEYSILATCSPIEVVNCLNDIWQAMKSWTVIE